MNAVIRGVRSRKRVSRPWESMATPGQKVSSNTKNTLRRAMMRLRWANAHVRTHSARSASARELNEDLLELGLADLTVPHQHRLVMEPSDQLRQPLLSGAHRTFHPLAPHLESQDAGQLTQPFGNGGIQAERDHLADPDLALERIRAALGENSPGLDERDGVAELL